MHIPIDNNLKKQQGMATLTLSIIILLLMSSMMLFTSGEVLLSIKAENNQYFQTKAMEASRGALELTLAWMVTGTNTSNLTWTTDDSGPDEYDQKATLTEDVSSQSISGYPVTVTLWRNSAEPAVYEALATASGDATSVVRQKILQSTITNIVNSTVDVNKFAPIVVNGGISGITGTPDVTPSTNGGVAVATSLTKDQSSLIQLGHLDLNGGFISYGSFTGTAWDYIFPSVTKAQMKVAADYVTIYYYDATKIITDKSYVGNFTSLNTAGHVMGSSGHPIILVFDTGAGCPKLNGQLTIYGIVYYADSCEKNGWGGATIYGNMVAETSITKLTANSEFSGWGQINAWDGTTPGTILIPTSTTTVKTLAKQPASWRDF